MKACDIISDILDRVIGFAERDDVREKFLIPRGYKMDDSVKIDYFNATATYKSGGKEECPDITLVIPWEEVYYLNQFDLGKVSAISVEMGLVREGD